MAKRCVCGAVMDDDMSYCTECGRKLEAAVSGGARTCPKCGQPIEDDALFCVYCGQRLRDLGPMDAMPKCPKCGALVGAGEDFCTACGTRLKEGAAPSDRRLMDNFNRMPPEPPLDEHFHEPDEL